MRRLLIPALALFALPFLGGHALAQGCPGGVCRLPAAGVAYAAPAPAASYAPPVAYAVPAAVYYPRPAVVYVAPRVAHRRGLLRRLFGR